MGEGEGGGGADRQTYRQMVGRANRQSEDQKVG